MSPTARARCRVPAWVPDALASEYAGTVLREGEEAAARWCRRLKREMEGSPNAQPSRRPAGGSANPRAGA